MPYRALLLFGIQRASVVTHAQEASPDRPYARVQQRAPGRPGPEDLVPFCLQRDIRVQVPTAPELHGLGGLLGWIPQESKIIPLPD